MNGPIYTTTKSLQMDRKNKKQGQIKIYSRDLNHNQGRNQEEDINLVYLSRNKASISSNINQQITHEMV